MRHWILASSSPRRRDLLEQAGVSFKVMASPAEELHDESMDFRMLCEENAERKAQAISDQHPQAWVIGADTLVSINQRILGKPHDENEARAMLRMLSGRSNQVCTGVCLLGPGGKKLRFHEISDVDFLSIGEPEIEKYMSKVNTLDKAGAYAAQEFGELIIREIRGDFSNIVGLPIRKLLMMMNELS